MPPRIQQSLSMSQLVSRGVSVCPLAFRRSISTEIQTSQPVRILVLRAWFREQLDILRPTPNCDHDELV